MRYFLFLFILLAPVLATAQSKHKPMKIPVSRWKEVKRMRPDSVLVPFNDTLFITFRAKDSFSYHNKNGFIYNGAYTINEDSLLDFGTARYKIAVKRPTALVLRDDAGIHTMGIDSSDTAKVIVMADEKILPVTSIDQMIGRWTVYKRTAKEAGTTIDNAVAIRSVYVTGPSTDGKQGYLFSGKDPTNAPSWYIKSLSADQSLNCDGINPRTFKVVKCQKGEMILEEGDFQYFLKQFK